MKKNKKLLSLLLSLVMIAGLAGCGGSSKSSGASEARSEAYDSGYVYGTNAAVEAPAAAEQAMADYDAAEPTSAAGLGSANGQVPTAEDMSEKIIYNADVTLETTAFDDALERIAALVKEMGGYMESSSISGSNYSSISKGNAGARNAYYTIRIPASRFSDLVGTISDLGNVPYSNTYTRNVTTKYYDTQSRLEAYRVQEKRLLEMLSIAESVEDMLAIQRELTDVQYEIDSLTGTLRYFDNQVGYSTVSLTVVEVREYTPEPTIQLTYWERMSKGFRESLHSTANFFTELFLWFVTSLPWLIPLAVFLGIVIALLRRRAAKNPERAAARQARREARAARRAERKAKKAGLVNRDETRDEPKE